MTIKENIVKYGKLLKDITHIPNKEVEILIQHIVQKNTIWLHLNYNEEFKEEQILENLVKKRATNFPLEYITKKASFYGEIFYVDVGVLIPRPESEILVEIAVEILKKIENPKVVEIGVGSGIISVMLAKLVPNIEIIAVDINEKALSLAKKNATYHEVEDSISFLHSDLLSSIKKNSFDMCVSNPPYIANSYNLPKNVEFEPSNALFGGEAGDELLKRLILQVDKKDIKYLICEFGYDQRESIKKYLEEFEIKSLEFYKDYEDFDRGFTVEFKNKKQ